MSDSEAESSFHSGSEVKDELEDNEDLENLVWTAEESKQLIEAVRKSLPKVDRHSYIRRLKTVKWNDVVINGRTIDECKDHLQFLIKKIRHIRTMDEILQDVSINLAKGPESIKPKSAYVLYCKDLIRQKADMKGKNFFHEASSNFKALTDAQRAKYDEEAQRQKEMYGQLKQQTQQAKYTSGLMTPFLLYCKQQFALGNSNKSKLRTQYCQLPEDQRLKLIKKSIKNVKETEGKSVDLAKFLSKTELKLLKGVPKAPLNAYNLFVQDFCCDKNNDFKKASERYRELSAKDKAKYVQTAQELKDKYLKDMEVYKLTLTPEELEDLNRQKKTKAPASVTEPVAVVPAARAAAMTALPITVPSAVPSATSPSKKKSRKASVKTESDSSRNLSESAVNGSKHHARDSSSDGERRVAKKKVKIEKIPEPDKVPSSCFKYFKSHVYKGKEKKARKAYLNLPSHERKQIKRDFKASLKAYMSKLEIYLQSLTKDEMIAYADRSRQAPEDESDDSFTSGESSSSDSS